MAVAVEPLAPLRSPQPGLVADIDGVTYWYPHASVPALVDVSIALQPGVTLIGSPSGGGKSTLLRLLDGLVPQFHGGRIAGRVSVGGLDTFRTPIARLAREAGIVFQDPETQAVYGTVEREIAFALENAAVPRREMHDRVDEAMDRLGIAQLAGRRLATLSGGERQRVQIAAALVLRPPLLALDEPTSQLDRDGAAAVLGACRDLADGGTAIVVAEHRMAAFQTVADVVLAVDHGSLATARRVSPRVVSRPARLGATPLGGAAWELHGVSASPGRGIPPVLAGLELAGAEGEIVAVAGPNGSGKTTLLRTIAGLVPAVSGMVERRPGRVAYLPQNPSALLHLPAVRDEVELTLRRGGADSTAAATEADGLLDRLGLGDLAGRYPRDLSGGERQRAALAAVLAGHPAIALLDEPTRGMDDHARRALVSLVRELALAGTSVVLATHDAELVDELAGRVIELHEGSAEVRPTAPASSEATP